MSKEIILETKLVGDIEGAFYVPSYQRGYRWGKDEVLRLLEDVLQNGEKNYCLQPIVVRKKRDGSYELIDGQQRLTTIYLIYSLIREAIPKKCKGPRFSLIYETRDKSAEFLENIELERREENIDFWFMANAYEVIEEWFEESDVREMHLFQYFAENVKVIWYEVGPEEDVVSLFTRLNIGRIPLTSSELVKAMFLSRDNDDYRELSDDERERKQNEISLQWDSMEKELHNDSMWYFLTNMSGAKYQTRIDLVLDLIAGKEQGNQETYYTFFKLDEMRKDSSLDDLWKEIKHTFMILKDWHEDHELYHKIGYLIASKSKNLGEIYKECQGKTKDDFKASLDDFIKESIEIDGSYSDLRYDSKQGYNSIHTLLLLFNVESVRQNGENTQWFPFEKFKFGKDEKTSWSLEHIHAQQSEGLGKKNLWKEWLSLHIPSVKNVAGPEVALVDEMQVALDDEHLTGDTFKDLQQRVFEVLSEKGSRGYMHSIANMALLNSNNNAALSNSTFDVKRNEIIEMDKRGEFIPFCTKMAFLKYYTASEDNQLHFWGHADRVAYIDAINTILCDYLPEKIEIEKGDE